MNNVDWGNFFGGSLINPASGLSQLLIFAGTMAALFYFFFSKEHTGVFKGVARFGIWILMVGFGASFGYTVMGRISLFVQRIQYVGDWTKSAWSASGGTYPVIWFITVGIFVLLAVYEVIQFLGRRKKEA